ncbi:hypothetical protein POSPLADRAFT_1056493 [Postia placenta MAD-698-R-SB12]|uniref:F-box domain-containing protein n=1 Tax=Postia placenta MAD-698-R-SB12 TaxID=670580 RepID=A0A1X6N3X4_9APHY|nr:hypothetical protein POSPLADRAFT_1056493 [Postia placenta MAD-698-R-SB12]OSX63132.1 hypothetical protein POSPLADRAFT_1056493 [Postia placenta MAD-698-R-SB12]
MSDHRGVLSQRQRRGSQIILCPPVGLCASRPRASTLSAPSVLSTGITIQSHLVLVAAPRWRPRLPSAPLAVHAGRRSPVQRTHGTPRPRVPAPTRSREFVRGDTPRFSGTQDAHATRDTRHTASSAATTTRAPFAVSISSVSVQRTTGPARGASASTPSAPRAAHSSSTDHRDGHITAVLSPPALLLIHIHIHIPSAPAPPPSAAKPPISTPPPTPARPASRAPAPIQTLPAELLEHVLLLAAPASPAAPAALARTCRAFAALVYAAPDQHLWRALFLRAWDDPRALSGEAGVSSREGAGAGIDWGREYRRRVAAQRWFASARADGAGAGTMGAHDVARTADALEALVVASPPTSSPRSFAVNLVSDPFAQHANACAVNAPPHASKWALSGLTHAPSISPPRTRRAAWGARSARSAPARLASSNCAGPASYIIAAGRSGYIHIAHCKLLSCPVTIYSDIWLPILACKLPRLVALAPRLPRI